MENCFEQHIPTKIMRSILVAIICASLLVVPLPATVQVSGDALSMICDDTMMVNDPLAGGPQNFSCTVSNPTAYVEKIAVQVTATVLQPQHQATSMWVRDRKRRSMSQSNGIQ